MSCSLETLEPVRSSPLGSNWDSSPSSRWQMPYQEKENKMLLKMYVRDNESTRWEGFGGEGGAARRELALRK